MPNILMSNALLTNTQNLSQPRSVDYTIISEHYWPSLPKDNITYHPQINTLLGAYLDAYAVLKKPRKLHPAQSLGQVEVDLVFAEGVERSFVVTPMQVRFVLLFFFHFSVSRSGWSTQYVLYVVVWIIELESFMHSSLV